MQLQSTGTVCRAGLIRPDLVKKSPAALPTCQPAVAVPRLLLSPLLIYVQQQPIIHAVVPPGTSGLRHSAAIPCRRRQLARRFGRRRTAAVARGLAASWRAGVRRRGLPGQPPVALARGRGLAVLAKVLVWCAAMLAMLTLLAMLAVVLRRMPVPLVPKTLLLRVLLRVAMRQPVLLLLLLVMQRLRGGSSCGRRRRRHLRRACLTAVAAGGGARAGKEAAAFCDGDGRAVGRGIAAAAGRAGSAQAADDDRAAARAQRRCNGLHMVSNILSSGQVLGNHKTAGHRGAAWRHSGQRERR